MESADMDEFVQALQEEDLMGLSTYNPTNQKNNCVFVTLAYLMGFKSTVDLDEEIKKDMAKLDPKAGGIPLSKIPPLLKKTGKQFVFKNWKKNPDQTGSGIQAAASPSGKPTSGGTNVAWLRDEQFLLGEWNVKQIGICYKRPAGMGGHCIVLKEGDSITGPQYLCYQTDSNGKDLWADALGKDPPTKDTSGEIVPGKLKNDLEYKDGTKVLGAFAIIDHADILARDGPARYARGNKNAQPSGTAMLANTLGTIMAPATRGVVQALVTHVSKPATAKPVGGKP